MSNQYLYVRKLRYPNLTSVYEVRQFHQVTQHKGDALRLGHLRRASSGSGELGHEMKKRATG